MDGDQVREPELAREAVGPAERLGGEHRQVLDVLRLALAEQRLQQRVAQDAVVEGLLEPVQRRPRRRRARTGTPRLDARRHAAQVTSPGPSPSNSFWTRRQPMVVAPLAGWISTSRSFARSSPSSTRALRAGGAVALACPSRRCRSASRGWRPPLGPLLERRRGGVALTRRRRAAAAHGPAAARGRRPAVAAVRQRAGGAAARRRVGRTCTCRRPLCARSSATIADSSSS